ncbi:MAG: efflux RND transporter periplasmic adaptor subunit [Vicinamibacteria bacterium]
MTRRVWFVLMVAIGLVAGLGVAKTLQIRSAIAQAASFQMPPEAVTTVKARLEPWPATLDAIGTVQAVRGVTVSADLPGVVEAILFESGQSVAAGAVLVRLDARQERAQLAAAEAQRDLAKLSLDRVRGLVAQGIVAQAELDRAAAEHKQAEARVGEIAATIERKQVRAPFAGVLGIRQVDLGQYLAGGAPIVPLQSLDPLHVDFSVPQQQVGRLRAGGEVRVSAEGIASPAAGTINALDSVVDEATRNVRVQATIPNPDGRLRPGMFVQVQAQVGQQAPLVALPASAVNYAPYGDSVYVVAEMEGQGGVRYKGVRQQFVKLGPARGDQVAVLQGVEAGAEVVSSGVFKLRNGAAVQVNNDVRPADSPAPRPEDN